MTSPVDVANQALDSIGARFSITSLEPPLPAPNAVVVARHYQPKVDALHRAAHWNCTRKQAALTVLKAAQGTPENPNGTTLPIPPVPWIYEYGYPPDCLKARYLVPNPPQSGAAASPILAGGTMVTPGWPWLEAGFFAVATDTDANGNTVRVILTNVQYAECVYTARITDPDLWDPHFLLAATATLGAWLVTPLSANAERLKEMVQIASSMILQARVSDGNEGMTTTDHVPDWMAVRGVTGYGTLDARPFYGWDSMAFPGGLV